MTLVSFTNSEPHDFSRGSSQMSYSEDYWKRTIEYREEGSTLEETYKVFKVSICAIRTWEK